MKLLGKNVIITGASQGLGYQIAKDFITEGASLLVCARSHKNLSEAVETLKKSATPKQQVIGKDADISDVTDVDNLVEFAIKKFGKIDVLVNNAGVYGPLGAIEDNDWKEWVKAIEINLLGNVYITKCLVPHMKKNRTGKIIFISGGGATNPLPNVSSYAASKAAIVRFAETMALELKEFTIDINSIAPGALATRLNDELLNAGPDVVGKEFYDRMKKLLENGGTPLEKGSALAVYLASDESNGITGKLISAPWDPWPQLQSYRADIDNSDIYTLRRITPKDRGKKWGDVK